MTIPTAPGNMFQAQMASCMSILSPSVPAIAAWALPEPKRLMVKLRFHAFGARGMRRANKKAIDPSSA